MKNFLIKIGEGAYKVVYGGLKLIAKHPNIGYFVIGLPACMLMYNGAMALAGEGVDLSDEIKKED